MRATKEQIALAHKYNIPDEQAWTINPAKVRNYERNPQVKLDKFLDGLDEKRLQSVEKQSFGGGAELIRLVSHKYFGG